ncbi:hypothetical protein [Paracoccus methylarcula]|uniref:hypothetical protein n=1 Tax=Paracoccus methylarcula TaxID=72022 RepID=UPI00269B0C67
MQVFGKLMSGLEAQLGGMATAFSSSLLGLAGSLVVGLLELFVTHGQNRFYRELEEWMSGFTRISLSSDGDEAGTAAGSGLLDQIASQIDWLQQFHAERDVARDEAAAMADERVLAMVEAVEALVQRDDAAGEATVSQAAALTSAMNRMTDGQDRLVELLQNQRDDRPGATMDMERLETALSRFANQLNEGRDEMVAELRLDLLVLTRAVRAARFGDPFRDDQLPHPSMSPQQQGE